MNKWDILDIYYKSNNYFISNVQLDSFNDFINDKISKTIRQFNPIINAYDKSGNNYKYIIESVIGGSLIKDEEGNENVLNDGNGIYIKKPIINESNLSRILYPNECRLKNLTYSFTIYVDIIISYKVLENNEYKISNELIKDIFLGSVPNMLHSSKCVLNNLPNNLIYNLGECIYDQGGYFIIDGLEKVIVSQERQVENKLYIKKTNNNYSKLETEIRCSPETRFEPARIIKMIIYNKTNDIQDNTIRLLIPNLIMDIPLFIIFRCLGIQSDREILEYICLDLDNEISNQIMDFMYPTIEDGNMVYSQLDAFLFLQNFLKINDNDYKNTFIDINSNDTESILSKIELKKKKENRNFAFIKNILENYLFSNIENDINSKARYLGYLVRESLLVHLNLKEQTNRDSYMYKRIDTSGYLIAQIFRDLYFRVHNEYHQELNKHFAVIRENRGENNVLLKTVIYKDNLTDFFNSSIMNEGFIYAFKNCWGLKNAKGCKQGIVQDLNRISYLGTISHIRKINTPFPKTAKIRDPHSVHSSSWGIICPVETPSGGEVGLTKNFSLLATISYGTSSFPIYNILLNNELILLNEIDNKSIYKYTKIFLNEKFIGIHYYPDVLVNKLKKLRRIGEIDIHTSISWYYMDNIIKISTDSGRSLRPLLIVENNKLNIDNVNNLKNKNWNYLTHNGYIEYIDVEESNTCMIALYKEDINNKSVRYTHCEIHPGTINSIVTSCIPFFDSNQAPRNIFSCSQTKQAVGIYSSNYKNRIDTDSQVLFYPQKPIVYSKFNDYYNINKLPYGVNTIIAIACYTGYNQDDSIIINKTSVDRGLFRSVQFKKYFDKEETIEHTNEKIIFKKPNQNTLNTKALIITDKDDKKDEKNVKYFNYDKLNDNGIVSVNTKVDDNDALIGKVMISNQINKKGEHKEFDKSSFVNKFEEGIVDKIYMNNNSNGEKYCKLRLRKNKVPELGDKFASRAGQKGVVGMILDQSDMPVSKDGIVPDMIINPQAFPKRMTCGQFTESILSKICCHYGMNGDGTPFEFIDFNNIIKLFDNCKEYEQYGNEILYNGQTGEQLSTKIFIGPTYYQRLSHQVSKKINARATGKKTTLSHQPTGGRSQGGGLRIGEMERDALLSHGVSSFLKESMLERADKYNYNIDNASGLIAPINKDKDVYNSYDSTTSRRFINDKNQMDKKKLGLTKSDYSNLNTPYTFKLLSQELMTMNIAPRMISSKVTDVFNKKVIDYSKFNEELDTESYYTNEGSKYSLPFRKFHNQIKSILINGINTNKVIDFGFGRGGDLYKYFQNDINYVLGIDFSHNNLFSNKDSAKIRLESFRKSSNNKLRNWSNQSSIHFVSGDVGKVFNNISNKQEQNKKLTELLKFSPNNNKFDSVSSMFMIHYLFENENKINNLFKNAKSVLKKNGYMIVTTLDGELVDKLLFDKDNKDHYIEGKYNDEKIWSIRAKYKQPFNKEYNKKISVFVESISDKETDEYLVHPHTLLDVATKNGFQLLSKKEINNNFQHIQYPSDTFDNVYKYIPIFNKEKYHPSINELNKEEYSSIKLYSNLHRYYIFKFVDKKVKSNVNELISKPLSYKQNQIRAEIKLPLVKVNYLNYNNKKYIEKLYNLNIGLYQSNIFKEDNDYYQKIIVDGNESNVNKCIDNLKLLKNYNDINLLLDKSIIEELEKYRPIDFNDLTDRVYSMDKYNKYEEEGLFKYQYIRFFNLIRKLDINEENQIIQHYKLNIIAHNKVINMLKEFIIDYFNDFKIKKEEKVEELISSYSIMDIKYKIKSYSNYYYSDKIAVIIPYKNDIVDNHFIENVCNKINSVLSYEKRTLKSKYNINIDYDIYLIEQNKKVNDKDYHKYISQSNNEFKFNKGVLINSAIFELIKNNPNYYTSYIIHDCNIIDNFEVMKEYINKDIFIYSKLPYEPITIYNDNKNIIISITREMFENTDGYPSYIWGIDNNNELFLNKLNKQYNINNYFNEEHIDSVFYIYNYEFHLTTNVTKEDLNSNIINHKNAINMFNESNVSYYNYYKLSNIHKVDRNIFNFKIDILEDNIPNYYIPINDINYDINNIEEYFKFILDKINFKKNKITIVKNLRRKLENYEDPNTIDGVKITIVNMDDISYNHYIFMNYVSIVYQLNKEYKFNYNIEKDYNIITIYESILFRTYSEEPKSLFGEVDSSEEWGQETSDKSDESNEVIDPKDVYPDSPEYGVKKENSDKLLTLDPINLNQNKSDVDKTVDFDISPNNEDNVFNSNENDIINLPKEGGSNYKNITINTNNSFSSNPNLKQIIKLGNNEQFNQYDTKTLKIDI